MWRLPPESERCESEPHTQYASRQVKPRPFILQDQVVSCHRWIQLAPGVHGHDPTSTKCWFGGVGARNHCPMCKLGASASTARRHIQLDRRIKKNTVTPHTCNQSEAARLFGEADWGLLGLSHPHSSPPFRGKLYSTHATLLTVSNLESRKKLKFTVTFCYHEFNLQQLSDHSEINL